MNWIGLKKYNLHLVDRQVDKAISLHQQLQQLIMQGDILSLQKLAELQHSIKQRIQNIDQFYNQNGLDQRIRFLQTPRMKLVRLLNSNYVASKYKQYEINTPWKKTQLSTSKISNKSSSRKKLTPNKKEGFIKSNQIRQSSRSPIVKDKNQKQLYSLRKPNITLQIPNDRSSQDYSFQQKHLIGKNNSDNKNIVKSGRKTQFIPQKTPITKLKALETNQIRQKKQDMPQKQNISSRVQISANGSSRINPTAVTARNRALTQSSNISSMKKLNDLIFTIKMTKQEYNDFMQIKKTLDHRNTK